MLGFYYSKNADSRLQEGVGVIANRKFILLVLEFTSFFDGIALLRLEAGQTVLNIIQVYAPTDDQKYDGDVRKLYGDIQQGESLINFCKENNINIMNTWFKIPKRRLYMQIGLPSEGMKINEWWYRMYQKILRKRKGSDNRVICPTAAVPAQHFKRINTQIQS